MKKVKYIFLFAIFVTHVQAASGNKYEFCEIYGIAGGAEDSFTQTLASRVLEKQRLQYDKICSSVSQEAYKFGRKYSTGAITNTTNALRWQKYQNFRDKIADKILKMSGY